MLLWTNTSAARYHSLRLVLDDLAIAPESSIKGFSEILADEIVLLQPCFEFGKIDFLVTLKLRSDLTDQLLSESKVLISRALLGERHILKGLDPGFFVK